MNCFVSVAGLCYGQMPALMALLFSVYPRNADLVLNSPCLGGFQCHFSQQLGQVWRLFLPPFKGALMEARLTRQKKKKRGTFNLQSTDKSIHPTKDGKICLPVCIPGSSYR